MKKQNQPPPRWATKLFRWYCNDAIVEDLEGDLNEFYFRNVENRGKRIANWIYLMDVLKFVRFYTVQPFKLGQPMNQFLLLKNYYKASVRSLSKNLLFSAINVLGLAISMSVGLFLITFVAEVNSYDNFHEDGHRIYRINSTFTYLDEPSDAPYASTSPLLAEKIAAVVEGIESMTVLQRSYASDIKYDDKAFQLQFIWASEEFFKVFSFDLLKGNPDKALTELNSIVLTEEMAIKLFGSLNVLNKQVTLDDQLFTVSGIVADPPPNSHIKFQGLASYKTLINKNKDNNYYLSWANMWNHYIYFKVDDGRDPRSIQVAIDQICEEENGKTENITIQAYLQPLLGIMPGIDVYNNIGVFLESEYVWVLILLTAVVILLACFNYTNLSLGRSLRRSMEIGIRKVNGASRYHIWLQFIVEATVISSIALLIALGLFLLLKDYFFIIDSQMKDIVSLDLSAIHLLYFLGFAILIGMLAGFFPAAIFSKISVTSIFKNVSNTRFNHGFTIKKFLIFAQYLISLSFIVAVSLINKQYQYSLDFDLGFKTENIINIQVYKDDLEPLVNSLRTLPEITEISQCATITSIGNYIATSMKYKNPLDSAEVYRNAIDENYLPLHGHEWLAGTNFVRGSNADDELNDGIIINESFLKRFNMGSPQDAIGEEILIRDQKKTIQAVLKDFHYGKMDHKTGPFAFIYESKPLQNINLKVNTRNRQQLLEKIEDAWKAYDNVHPLNASFYDDQIKASYEDQAADVAVIGIMAFLAIFIASMGLLGMVVFTTESKLKEISIRKVFGAKELSLVYNLGKSFFLLLLVAAGVAIPVTYYFINEVIFSEIVYKTSFNLMDIMIGVIVVFLIALVVIVIETIKAAKTNPATILRSE